MADEGDWVNVLAMWAAVPAFIAWVWRRLCAAEPFLVWLERQPEQFGGPPDKQELK